MSPPKVRVNTFLKENKKALVDPISKIFILMESSLGLLRLPLICKEKYILKFATFLIFLILNITIFYKNKPTSSVVRTAPIVQNIICTLLSYTHCKWLQRFYNELLKFDTYAACRPKVSHANICNILFCFLSCAIVILMFLIPIVTGFVAGAPFHLVPLYIVNLLEVYYFGHLLSLLIPRLKLINFYLESSLSNASTKPSRIVKEYVYYKSYDQKIAQSSMKVLMDLYETVVEAYDYLIEGIKWQLLVVIIGTFVAVLTFLFNFSLFTIHGDWVLKPASIYNLGIPVVLLSPLFAPCMFGDYMHSEVKKLRELLASRLYENKLDKAGRRNARALLAFTETRDLSFRLLRMLNIDISLPFKFVGLLVTYLIILLQFEKVIHP